MPVLGPDDPLPGRYRRVLVGGTSGSGKSTLARTIAGILGVPYTELDALYHGPGWTVRTEFEADVAALSAQPSWVTEYQYGAARPVLSAAADLVVYLLYPRWLVMFRLTRRTVRRAHSQDPLWNGNVEPRLRTVVRDREHIVRWAWRTHAEGPSRVAELARSRPELPLVVLRSPAQTRRFLASLERTRRSRCLPTAAAVTSSEPPSGRAVSWLWQPRRASESRTSR